MVAEIINNLLAILMLLSGDVVRREELNAGDHIFTYRGYGLYTHHGIYIGEGNVIHLTRIGVNKTSLDSFRQEGKTSLRSYAYGRPLLEYWLTRRGTRTTLLYTKSSVEVVNKAWELHESKGFGEYNLINNNCEHFATFCRTNVRASSQTELISACQRKVDKVKDWAMKVLQRIMPKQAKNPPTCLHYLRLC